MQKQESFYYQARAGAPTNTNTDTAAIGRSPELWVTLLIQGIVAPKFKKQESPGLIGHLLVKGQVLSSDWLSFPGLDSNFPGLAKGSDWFPGGGVRSGDFQRLFSRNLTKWSSLGPSFPPSLGSRTDPIMHLGSALYCLLLRGPLVGPHIGMCEP